MEETIKEYQPQQEAQSVSVGWQFLSLFFSFAALSLFVFIFTHYRSHTSSGSSINFDFDLATYIYYSLVLLVLHILVLTRQSKTKKVYFIAWIILVLHSALPYVLWAGPIGLIFAWQGALFWACIVYCVYLSVLLISTLTFRRKYALILSVSLFVAFIGTITAYANLKDLSFKGAINYMNNSVVSSADECHHFISPFKVRDCRSDFFRQWNFKDDGQDDDLIDADMSRDQIKTLKIGDGDLASEYSLAYVKVLQIGNNGSVSTLRSHEHLIPDLYNVPSDVLPIGLRWGALPHLDGFVMGIVGMRVGGIRDITFVSDSDLTVSEADPPIALKNGDHVTFRVQLVKADRNP